MSTTSEKSHDSGHKFFDPKSPEIPSEVLGIPSQPLIDLSNSVLSVATFAEDKLPPGVWLNIYAVERRLENGLRVFPLIQRIQAGEHLSDEDVRPYRKPIKKLVPKLNTADKWAALFGAVGVGIPIRRTINRKIEQEFSERLPELLQKAGVYAPEAEPYIDFIEQFENPREQFISEVTVVAMGIRSAAREHAKGHSRQQPEVTAKDAAFGIRQTIDKILSDPETQQSMPMLSHFIGDELSNKPLVLRDDVLGVAAPEIITALENVLPKDKRDSEFLSSVRRHEHPMRWMAEKFKGMEIRRLDNIADKLLPSIRDLLPNKGSDVRVIYQNIVDFLK
ncbi:MAG: hypothetical protein AAB971_03870 [Patescibacteria group bacterium]